MGETTLLTLSSWYNGNSQIQKTSSSPSATGSDSKSTSTAAYGPTLPTSTSTVTTTSTGTPGATGVATGAVTSGGFLDFIIAIVCLILTLKAHSFVKFFLNQIFPGGGDRGSSSLFSGLMEGFGMAAGRTIFRGGTNLAKTGIGLGASAGISGLASALSQSKNDNLFGMEGLKQTIGKWTSSGRKGSQGIADSSLLPSGERLSLPGEQDGDAENQTEYSTRSSSGSETTGGAFAGNRSMGLSSSATATTSTGTSSGNAMLFDKQSMHGGAYTKLRPSARSKMQDLSSLREKGFGGVAGAFSEGVKERFGSEMQSRLSGAGPKGHAKSVFNTVGQEVGKFQQTEAENKITRDSYVPSAELLSAARKNDPVALSDLERIGSYQQDMELGASWVEQGQALQDTVVPQFQQAQAEYDEASQEVDKYGAAMEDARRTARPGYENSPQFQHAQGIYQQSMQRQAKAQDLLTGHQEQMNRAAAMIQRGEKKVIGAQNNIAQTNMSWYADHQRNSSRIVAAAQARANRVTLSDLGQAPGSSGYSPNRYRSGRTGRS